MSYTFAGIITISIPFFEFSKCFETFYEDVAPEDNYSIQGKVFDCVIVPA
jgi:hypothetical protein